MRSNALFLRAKAAFYQQKYTACKREIDFQFSFADWLNWWEDNLGEDWFEKRGCKRGQFVMARDEDKGPYHPDNVKCTRAEDNHVYYNNRRIAPKGIRYPILPRSIVEEVFLSDEPYGALVRKHRKFGMTKHKIQCIKTKRYFKRWTDELKRPPGRNRP